MIDDLLGDWTHFPVDGLMVVYDAANCYPPALPESARAVLSAFCSSLKLWC